MAGFFLSFFAKVLQSREKKKSESEKFAFSTANIFYDNVVINVALTISDSA